jgi:hypothetical protein
MADQTFDPRLETMLRQVLAAEAAKNPLTTSPDQVLARRETRARSRRGPFDIGRPAAGVRRLSVSLVAVAVLAVAVVALRPNTAHDRIDPAAPLPMSPDAWSRAIIDAGSGRQVVSSLAVGPRGLLAVVSGDDGPAQLFASTDGDGWTLVPADQHPRLKRCGPDCYFEDDGARGPGGSIVGTDRGFLIVGSEIWHSDDGFDWQRLAGSADDPDLADGEMLAAAVAGPGYVAVGSDNKAWYSADGSDWALAEVPAPTDYFQRRGDPAPTVEMQGITEAGDTLFAWGTATSVVDPSGMLADRLVPMLWSSADGRAWINVLDHVDERDVVSVAAGPGGLVAIENGSDTDVGHPRFTVRLSADGQAWESTGEFDPRVPWPSEAAPYGEGGDIVEGMPLALDVTSAAATDAGYVAVGADGACHPERADGPPWCVPEEAAVWTSADGQSWSRLPTDDLFTAPESHSPAGAWATEVVAWESRFVIGGVYDGKPATWMSGAR